MTAVTGDEVEWVELGLERGRITRILPRRTTLIRGEGREETRVLAANVDLLIVLIAPQPAPEPALIDRFLAAAEIQHIQAALVLNKADLLSDEEQGGWQPLLEEYETLKYPVGLISSHSGEGLAWVRELMQGHISVLAGQSGVGKSSLTQALLPQASVRIGELSQAGGSGRHTTTATLLYHLDTNTDLLDSPGVRDFKLWRMPKRQIAQGYAEIARVGRECQFNDCLHDHEPGCQVRGAVEQGLISRRRHLSYLATLNLYGR
jgi:ribosome biogenesis GTPase